MRTKVKDQLFVVGQELFRKRHLVMIGTALSLAGDDDRLRLRSRQ